MNPTNKKVLIIEDEHALLDSLRMKLEKGDLSVLVAVDGEGGLIIALQEHPDLILLDILMPKMDGLTFLHRLREDAWGKHAMVWVLSNLTSEENEAQLKAAGVTEYIVKSDWKIDDIVNKVKISFVKGGEER